MPACYIGVRRFEMSCEREEVVHPLQSGVPPEEVEIPFAQPFDVKPLCCSVSNIILGLPNRMVQIKPVDDKAYPVYWTANKLFN